MTYFKKSSFSYGEIDPALHDKTDIKSYYSGLKTARNVLISKTGRVINNSGTWFKTVVSSKCAYYSFSQFVITLNKIQEFVIVIEAGTTKLYLVDYEKFTFTQVVNNVNSLTQDNIDNITFDKFKITLGTLENFEVLLIKDKFNESLIYLIVDYSTLPLPNGTYSLSFSPLIYNDWPQITSTLLGSGLGIHLEYTNVSSATMSARTGHDVVYGFSAVSNDGIESPIYNITKYRSSGDAAGVFTSSVKLPTGTEQTIFFIKDFYINNFSKYGSQVKEFRIYRKPLNENAYGLIAVVKNNNTYIAITNYQTGQHIDFGQEADYTNPPPELYNRFYDEFVDIVDLKAPVVGFYNQRLALAKNDKLYFSKINAYSYFLRDFPLTAATSMFYELGTKVNTVIYHIVEFGGVFAFTSEGIFFGGSDQPVSSLNPFLKKVDPTVVSETVPPIVTPFGLLVVDKSTKAIKIVDYDDNNKRIVLDDLSVFSNHLFYGKEVVAWAFHESENPHLFVILNDGTAATFNFSKKNEMNAWTRVDTDGQFINVHSYKTNLDNTNYLLFLVYRNGQYVIESSSRRVLLNNQTVRSFAHSAKYTRNIGFTTAPLPATAILATLTDSTGNWDDIVKVVTFVGQGYVDNVGKTFAIYNAEKDDYYYLLLDSAVLGIEAVFTVLGEAVPQQFRNVEVELIECHSIVTGLTHLEGKKVSVYADNAVIASPYNEHLALPDITVTGGQITLSKPVAFSIVGLPYISDVETLDIDTKEGTMSLDAKIVNRVVVKCTRTRGVYISGKFPEQGYLDEMEYASEWNEMDTVNKPLVEKIIAKDIRPYSSWETNGRIAIRQVDPLPFEITSIIADVSS